MGRLNLRSMKGWKTIRAWLIPVFVSWLVLFGVHNLVAANTPPSVDELVDYLKSNELQMGVESVNGYQQIYYVFDGQKNFITGAPYNHVNPTSSGSLVVWQGLHNNSSQIYVYDILSGVNIHLTGSGTHQNAYIKENIVVWETWVKDHWEISYFDGLLIHKLNNNELASIRPITDGQKIFYAEQSNDKWMAVEYDIESKKYRTVKEGSEVTTAFPRLLSDDKLTTDVKNRFK